MTGDSEAAPPIRAGRLWWHRVNYVLNLTSFAVLVWFAVSLAFRPLVDSDGAAYWNAWHVGLYAGHWPQAGAYIYSPPFAQLILWPLTQMPFGAYWAILTVIQMVALTVVLRPPLALLVFAVPWWPHAAYLNPVYGSLVSNNIDVTLGAVLAVALRYPAAWAFVLLTKITPGIGLLWFAIRREWRSLAIALGVTAGISLISIVVAPNLWIEWIAALRATDDPGYMAPLLNLSLPVRIGVASLIIVWGALTERRWTMVLGAGLALPQLGYGSYAVLVIALGAWLGRPLSHHDLLDIRVRERG